MAISYAMHTLSTIVKSQLSFRTKLTSLSSTNECCRSTIDPMWNQDGVVRSCKIDKYHARLKFALETSFYIWCQRQNLFSTAAIFTETWLRHRNDSINPRLDSLKDHSLIYLENDTEQWNWPKVRRILIIFSGFKDRNKFGALEQFRNLTRRQNSVKKGDDP
jgi:hypothetical protein